MPAARRGNSGVINQDSTRRAACKLLGQWVGATADKRFDLAVGHAKGLQRDPRRQRLRLEMGAWYSCALLFSFVALARRRSLSCVSTRRAAAPPHSEAAEELHDVFDGLRSRNGLGFSHTETRRKDLEGMKTHGLNCFRSLWGSPSALKLASNSTGSYASQLLAHVRRQGFDGIEASLGDVEALGGAKEVLPLLKENELELIVGVYSGWVDYEPQNLPQQFESVESHVNRLREQLETACSFTQRPVRINVHSGSDHWRPSEQMEFLSRVQDLERQVGCDDILAHETHRGRMFYSPWPTLALLDEFPSLKLTLDFSHWCVVTERLLDTAQDDKWLLEKVVPRVRHVHGRVGTDQAAQLPYPDDDELSRDAVERFQRLWDAIWAHQKTEESGKPPTFTPEYGPIPYAPRHHEDRQFEAYNVDELCAQQATAQREKFEHAGA